MFKYLLLALSFVLLVFSDVSARKHHKQKGQHAEQSHNGGKKHGGKGKHHGGGKKHHQSDVSDDE